jgi:sugar phosphate isomerase/epimerase
VRKRFEDSGVRLLSLGTTCEFHSADRAIVDANIRECGEFVRLAGDVGAAGVKVRPNGLPEGVPIPDTLARIAHALQVCGEDARPFGVEIWLEVHGRGTCELPHIETILNHVDLPNVRACWNSNPQDLEPGGGLEANIARVAGRIGNVHINTLWGEYPYRELFKLLRESGYAGYCLAELGSGSTDPIPLMHCYHALFRELCRA